MQAFSRAAAFAGDTVETIGQSVVQRVGLRVDFSKFLFGSDLWQFLRKEHLDQSVICVVLTMRSRVPTPTYVLAAQSRFFLTEPVLAVVLIAVKM